MAIAPTGAIYKTLTFGGVSSADFGVYITGEAVFNAPQRDVEMVTIPGRNGTFALDNGRFENIEVSYPAGIFADTEAGFAEAVSEFRNFLCSRNGYVRLEDDYNPSEYRMAVYKSGLEVTPALLKAGEFTLTFDCKPQRWLTSGETAISVESGDTITNPTRFESGPMLEVEGYGNISFNGYDIDISDETYGDIEVLAPSSETVRITRKTVNCDINSNMANAGDSITITNLKVYGYTFDSSITFASENVTGSGFAYQYSIGTGGPGGAPDVSVEMSNIVLAVGTPSTLEYTVRVRRNGEQGTYLGGKITLNYDGASNLTITFVFGLANYGDITYTVGTGVLHSTKLYVEGTIIIDAELGDVYKVEGGEYISLNAYIDLGTDLPKLAVGDTEITYDNTITSLEVKPGWWKV